MKNLSLCCATNRSFLVVSVFFVALLAVSACVQERPNQNEGEELVRPEGMNDAEIEEHKQRLRELFERYRKAKVVGDLKVLREVTRTNDGRQFSIEELQKYEEALGDHWQKTFSDMEITDEFPVTLVPGNQPDFPDADLMATIPVRVGDGSASFRTAVHIDGNWYIFMPEGDLDLIKEE